MLILSLFHRNEYLTIILETSFCMILWCYGAFFLLFLQFGFFHSLNLFFIFIYFYLDKNWRTHSPHQAKATKGKIMSTTIETITVTRPMKVRKSSLIISYHFSSLSIIIWHYEYTQLNFEVETSYTYYVPWISIRNKYVEINFW